VDRDLLHVLADGAQVISAIGVVVGLPLVLWQIHTGNKALRSSAYQGMVGNSFTLIQNVLNDDAMLSAMGTRLFPEGQPVRLDEVRWHFMALAVMRHYENLHVQHRLHSIDDDQWSGYRSLLSWYMGKEAFRRWWTFEHRQWFSSSYQREIDDLIGKG